MQTKNDKLDDLLAGLSGELGRKRALIAAGSVFGAGLAALVASFIGAALIGVPLIQQILLGGGLIAFGSGMIFGVEAVLKSLMLTSGKYVSRFLRSAAIAIYTVLALLTLAAGLFLNTVAFLLCFIFFGGLLWTKWDNRNSAIDRRREAVRTDPQRDQSPVVQSQADLSPKADSPTAVPTEIQEVATTAPAQSPNAGAQPVEVEPEPEQPEDLEVLLSELDAMIGLEAVKQQVQELITYIRYLKIRDQNDMTTSTRAPLNLRLEGAVGTGKTTVARILARIYFSLGITKAGSLVEPQIKDLIGEHHGATEKLTEEVLRSALGKVLLLDEAYSLARGKDDVFGHKLLATLLRFMEDNRDDCIIFVAGYQEEMHEWLSENAGLKSRFQLAIEFESYSTEELHEIFDAMAKKDHYVLLPDAEARVVSALQELRAASPGRDFGNGRAVRNLFEHVVSSQFSRLDREFPNQDASREDLRQIKTEDIEVAVKRTLASA